jgi:AraC family transcriptional regulator
LLTVDPLVIDWRDENASQHLFAKPPLLTSHPLGWNTIYAEYHHQDVIDTPSHYLKVPVISLKLNDSGYVERWINGTLRREWQKKGMVTIIPSEVCHRYTSEQADQFMVLALDPLSWADMTQQAHANFTDLFPQLVVQHDPLVLAIGLALKAELELRQGGDRLYVESLATMLAIHINRKYASGVSIHPPTVDGLPRQKLQDVLDYIHTHLDEKIGLLDLAERVGVSQYHFTRLFKQAVGLSPYRYVIQQRIEQAKRLLHDSETKIADIALQCGFANQSHFTKHFHQLVGVTPKQYRQCVT